MLILLGVFLVGLVVFHLLERLAPIKAGYRPVTRRAFMADITAALVDGPVLSALTRMGAFYVIMLFPQYGEGLALWNWWLQLAVFFLVNDFARYWLHRWHHESDLLWRIHRVHHTAVEMDALSTFRVHLLEAVIKYGVIILPFHILGIDRSVTLIYSSIDILKGFWHHANLRTYIGRLNYIFNSAELHWWHHSVEARGQRANYGSTLSIWDWLFGTAYWPRGQWPDKIGVAEMERFPDTWHELLVSVRYSDEEAVRVYGGGGKPAGEAASARAAAADTAPDAQPPAAAGSPEVASDRSWRPAPAGG